MNTPQHAGLFSRYLLENPYPIAGALGLVGLILLWQGLREGRADRLRVSLIPLLLCAAVVVTATLVVTPSEHARRVVLAFVDAIVAQDVNEASRSLSPEVSAHLGSPRNVAHDIDFIEQGLDMLFRRYAIEGNRISSMDREPTSSTAVTVRMSCWTETGWGTTPSSWQLVVERQEDERWLITRLTCLTVNGQAPPSRW